MELDLLRTSSLGTAGRSLPEWNAPTLTWSSMNRMNSQMIREVENLSKLLDPSPDNQGPEAEFHKYLRNYETLQAALEDLEETKQGKSSQLADCGNTDQRSSSELESQNTPDPDGSTVL